jgi:RsiW-degrading membrane proteinase PrsW (M82 family)
MPHYEPIASAILIASVVPLGFLYIVKWLNFYETHRFRYILIALIWGAISLELAYLVNHPLKLIFGLPFVATRTGPSGEEIFKSLILLYLVRRGAMTSFIDGAIYGFASGIGFAIAENMLYLSRVDIDTGVVIGTSRAFMAAVLHGSTTAIVGMAVGGFPLGRVKHPLIAWVVGLVVAISIHTTFNVTVFRNFLNVHEEVLILALIAFSALTLVGLTIMWGLGLERRKLRKSLGLKKGVSKGEAMLVQRAEDMDELLAPIEERYGEIKREQVANALLLAAQLAMKQDMLKRCRDPELRTELAPQITELKQELKQARHDVGIYIMSYVRSIMPKAKWSLWARLGQTLSSREARSASGTTLWDLLRGRLVAHNASGESMHSRIQAALDLRERAASLAIEGDG